MSVLCYSLGLVLVAFLVQLVFWRIYLPRNQMMVLLYIFLGTLVVGVFALLKFSNGISFLGVSVPRTAWEYLQLSLLFVSMTLAYISAYSAIAADSPSLVMIMKIARSGPDGLDKEKLFATMTDDVLVEPRIRDLIDAGMAYTEGDRYKIATRSILFIRILFLYRQLLGMSKGG